MYEIWRKSSDKQLSKNVHKCKLGQAFDKSDPYVKFGSVRVLMSFCLFVCFVDLRPKSTAMVMVGGSVHLTTLFHGQA